MTHRTGPARRTVVDAADDPVLRRTLVAAGLPTSGLFATGAGWVSRVWVGDEHVVRTSEGRFRDAYRYEAQVLGLLAGSEVPHARVLAHGEGPDGPWCVSERLPGQTLHAAWPTADAGARRSIIEGTGLVDLAEALTQPADVELDTLLRWCARAREFPPAPAARGLDPADLAEVPGWLRGSYPELFASGHLHDRLLFYDVFGQLALCAHHTEPHERERARGCLADALSGRSHLDLLTW